MTRYNFGEVLVVVFVAMIVISYVVLTVIVGALALIIGYYRIDDYWFWVISWFVNLWLIFSAIIHFGDS